MTKGSIFYPENIKKPRVIVLTDISSLEGGVLEPDDAQSMVRFLLYACEFRIEGLFATSYGSDRPRPEYIRTLIGEYGKVWKNLLKHDSTYPSPTYLLSLVGKGSTGNWPEALWEDSECSEKIVEAVDCGLQEKDPLWILIWGGPLELARALRKVEQTRSAEKAEVFRSWIRVYAIGDQYDGSGPWIKERYPDLFYITSASSFRGMYRGGNPQLADTKWVEEHVRKNHGPLGAAYPMYDGGDPWGRVEGMKEGDSPSFLYLLPGGPGEPERPELESWGGRFRPVRKPDCITGSGICRQYTDAEYRNSISEDERSGAGTGSKWGKDEKEQKNPNVAAETVSCWRTAFQADFAARLDWCVKEYGEVNHPPVVRTEGPSRMSVRPGEEICLNASGSMDPDGDRLFFQWELYLESGTYSGRLRMEQKGEKFGFRAPQTKEGCEFSVLLTVRDSGNPSLSGYRRFFIQVKPERKSNDKKGKKRPHSRPT